AYQPRPAAEIERIAALVRSTVGFDKARGDQIEVVNLRFAEAPAPADFVEPTLVQSLLSPSKEDLLRIVELGVLALLTLIVLMAVVRPLLRRVLASDPSATPMITVVAGAGIEAAADGTILVPESKTAKLMEFAKINGQIQADTVQRVVDMVRASPSETVEVLRNWIQETP
ncbi:flagellar M-ring protein FliF, partial [Methylobacterium sp. WL122]